MTSTPRPVRWDPIVKITHWTIAIAVLVNAVVTREGSDAHVWVGYALASVLVLRLFWGLVGPAPARFASFPPSPARAWRHIGAIRRGEIEAHASHNPLGALMVYAIWTCLAAIALTGMAMAGPPPPVERIWNGAPVATTGFAKADGRTGDAAEDEEAEHEGDERREGGEGGEGDESGEELLEEAHEVLANLLYVLILLHIAGVLFESRRTRQSLVRAILPRWHG